MVVGKIVMLVSNLFYTQSFLYFLKTHKYIEYYPMTKYFGQNDFLTKSVNINQAISNDKF